MRGTFIPLIGTRFLSDATLSRSRASGYAHADVAQHQEPPPFANIDEFAMPPPPTAER